MSTGDINDRRCQEVIFPKEEREYDGNYAGCMRRRFRASFPVENMHGNERQTLSHESGAEVLQVRCDIPAGDSYGVRAAIFGPGYHGDKIPTA